jgi:hypothetical protein
MSVKRTVVKSCCGGSNSSIVYHMDKPIKASQLVVFEQAGGWTIPPHYLNMGILYLRKNGLTVSSSFGVCKVTVKVGEHDKEAKLQEFEALLEQAINS